MISRRYRCIFVHVPKTAGQSVESFFLNLHGLTWDERAPLLLRPNEDPNVGPERLAHLTAREYLANGHVSQEEFSNYFKFSFVRNPWARLVSEYKYRSIYHRLSFKDFVTRGLPPRDKFSDLYRHVQPQAEFVHDEDGKPLVDFVGKFETLQQDFNAVCERLAIPPSPLPFRNQSAKPAAPRSSFAALASKLRGQSTEHYSAYYDAELQELVGELYAADIRAFNYEFQSR